MQSEEWPVCPKQIARQGILRTYEKGETLLLQGFRDRHVFVLQSGQACVYRLQPSGRRYNLSTITPGQTIGETEFLAGDTAPNMVEITQPSTLLALPPDAFLQWVKEDGDFALHVMKLLATRLSELSGRVAKSTALTVEQNLLVQLAAALENSPDEIWKEQLFHDIPATRRSCNRALHSLVEKGLVQAQGQRLYVPDAPRVFRLCKELFSTGRGEFAQN